MRFKSLTVVFVILAMSLLSFKYPAKSGHVSAADATNPFFSESALHRSLTGIYTAYQEAGYLFLNVDPQVTPADSGRVHVFGVDATRVKEDDLLEKALEAGATDVKHVDKVFEVTTAPDEIETVRQALERQGIAVLEAQVDMVPQSTVRVDGKDAAAVLRLIEAIEEQDDVQSVYSNYDIADEVIDAVSAA